MRVPKSVDTDGLAPKGHDAVDGVEPQQGEFDAVLADKKTRTPGGRRADSGPAQGRPGSGASPDDRGGVGGGRARPGGSLLGHGRPAGPSPPGVDGDATTRADTGAVPAREAAAREALRGADPDTARPGRGESPLPTNLVAPHHTRWEPAASAGVDAAPAADSLRSAEVAARVERIAEQIVQASEVRLHRDGAVEARLQLDLGRLGRLDVALERTAEGRIRVVLSPASAEGANLLRSRGHELAQRLEARGLNLQELRVESSGETVLRLQGEGAERAEAPTVVAETTRAQADPGQAAPPRQERQHDDGERRGRREPEPGSAEEDEQS